MKKLFTLILFLLTLSGSSFADGFRANTFTATGSDVTIINVGTSIAFHKLTWNPQGTVSTCTVALDSSTDGVSWSAGNAIANQTCTAAGNTAVTAGNFNYVRITVTVLSGGGNVTVSWNGYVNLPGGVALPVSVANGGTGLTSGTSGGIPAYTGTTTMASSPTLTVNTLPKGGGAGATPTNSSVSDNGTTVSTSENIVTTGCVQTGSAPPGCPTGGTASAIGMTQGTVNSALTNADELQASAGLAGGLRVRSDSTGAGVGTTGTLTQSLCINVTPVTVNANVSTDQNLMSCSLDANKTNLINRTLRIFLSGVYSTPAASTTAVNVKVKLGSLTLASITTTALAGIQATNDQFNETLYTTTQTAGATASYEVHGNLTIDLGVGNTVADSTFADVNSATVGTVDSTAAQTLQVTIAFTVASGSNSATQRQLIVELVGP